MFENLRKIAAPLVLFSALLFLTGATSAVASLAAAAGGDLCCQNEAESREPVAEPGCSDSDCRCLSCSVPLLVVNGFDALNSSDAHFHRLGSRFIPSPPGRSIDYPPEFS